MNAADDYVTEVVAMGYKDTNDNFFLKKENNPYGNEFSNEISLMRLAGGGIARIAECRSIGHKAPSSYISAFYGTRGVYQFSNAQHLVTRLDGKGVSLSDVSDLINPKDATKAKHETGGGIDFKNEMANHTYQWSSPSPAQDEKYKTVPKEFEDLPNGHMASHQLLINDFMTALYERSTPSVDAKKAYRYTVPGLVAHESALLGGEKRPCLIAKNNQQVSAQTATPQPPFSLYSIHAPRVNLGISPGCEMCTTRRWKVENKIWRIIQKAIAHSLTEMQSP